MRIKVAQMTVDDNCRPTGGDIHVHFLDALCILTSVLNVAVSGIPALM